MTTRLPPVGSKGAEGAGPLPVIDKDLDDQRLGHTGAALGVQAFSTRICVCVALA